jgi:tetratricopeptide (TPR) repeat protein
MNIFIASSGELKEEREQLILIVKSVNIIFDHLHLDTFEWEIDMPRGSVPTKRIQDEINKKLDESDIVIVLFYSKIGKFTIEEYKRAIEKDKKVFLYFKQGVCPKNTEECKNLLKVFEFMEEIEKENKTLIGKYKGIEGLKFLVLEDLSKYLKLEIPTIQMIDDKVPKELTRRPSKNIDFIGRRRELEHIGKKLAETDKLLVYGMGGVGKTELCKHYYWDNLDNYKHLAWVEVVGSIRESFVDNFKKLSGIHFREEDTNDDKFEKICDFLRTLDKNSLLVIDNIMNETQKDLQEILRFDFKVIVSSRLKLKGFKTYELEFLSKNACKELFYNFYEGERNDKSVEKIIDLAGRHTLTIELLAQTAQNAAKPINDFLVILKNQGFNLNKIITEIPDTTNDIEGNGEKFFDQLLKIFNLSNVRDDELHVLTNLSVLPPVFISTNELKKWLGLENNDDINSLVYKGWLKREGFDIFMHPVIQEVVRHKASPNVKKCENIIKSLANDLYLEPNQNPIDKRKNTILAESLLQNFDENDKNLASLANNLAEIYLCLGSLEKADNFQMKALKMREYIYKEKHPDLANSYNLLSLIYRNKGQLEEALTYQLKNIEITKIFFHEKHPFLADSYNNLSLIYKDMGKLDEALEYQLKDLEITDNIFNKNSPLLATSYNNLSLILKTMGNLEDAFRYQMKAIEIREEVLPENHPDLAGSYSNLAVIYKDMGQPEKALEYQLKDVAILKNVWDEIHPNLAISYSNLAFIYLDLANYKSACQYIEKAVAILQVNFPGGSPELDFYKKSREYIKSVSKKALESANNKKIGGNYGEKKSRMSKAQ